jgi:putative sterol carrier protein
LQRVRRILADSRRVLLELRRTLAPISRADDLDESLPVSGDAPRRATSQRVRRFASVESYFATLARRFDPSAAGELDAVFQWRLSGDRPCDHWATVKRGHIETAAGVHAMPTVTIEMSSDDYLRMINGELSGPFAFSTGRGRLRGPVRLAMRMQQLFPLDRQV